MMEWECLRELNLYISWLNSLEFLKLISTESLNTLVTSICQGYSKLEKGIDFIYTPIQKFGIVVVVFCIF